MDFTLPSQLWQLLTSPNITYLLLMLGAWSIITALIIPGIGVPEGLVILCWSLAAIGLLKLPTNVAALLLILAALSLYILELKVSSHGILAIMATILLTVGSLFLFQGPDEAQRVSRWLIAFVSLSTLALFTFLTEKVLVAQQRPSQTGPRVRVGDKGFTKSDLNPIGVVYVADEEWTGESVAGFIPKGAPVIVVGVEKLRVYVQKEDASWRS